MLNLFQHLLIFRRLTASSSASLRLRVMPAMTGALQKGFLEVPLKTFLQKFYEELLYICIVIKKRKRKWQPSRYTK